MMINTKGVYHKNASVQGAKPLPVIIFFLQIRNVQTESLGVTLFSGFFVTGPAPPLAKPQIRVSQNNF